MSSTDFLTRIYHLMPVTFLFDFLLVSLLMRWKIARSRSKS